MNAQQQMLMDHLERVGKVDARDPRMLALSFPEIEELEQAGLIVGEHRMFGGLYGWRLSPASATEERADD